MSVELTHINNKKEEKHPTLGNVEEDVQEVGIVLELPHIYSNVGISSDIHRNSYTSISNQSKVKMQIRYDMEGTIMNYTTAVANLFHLGKSDDLIGETIMSLLDPSFIKNTPESSIYRYFGLPISEKELDCPEIHNVTAIQTNGQTFILRVIVISQQNNIITARLLDENEDISISSQSSNIIDRFASSSSFMQSTSSLSSNYGGIAVDLNTLNTSTDHWTDIGHYAGGIEESYQQSSSSTMNSTISLSKGVILLDMEVETMSDLLNLILDEGEMKHLISLPQRHAIEDLFQHDSLSLLPHLHQPTTENCKVYIASIANLFTPFVSLIRLGELVQMQNSHSPIRYFLFVLGESMINEELHEIGRVFSLMLSHSWFSKAASKITSPRLFLKLMDNFLTRCMMLPPPDPLAEYSTQLQPKSSPFSHCLYLSSSTHSMKSNQYNEHSLRHRRHVMNQHDHALINTVLQQEPTVDELEKNNPTPFMNFFTTKDRVISILTAIACILLFLLLNGVSLNPVQNTKHSSYMLESTSVVYDGLKAIHANEIKEYKLSTDPRGYYELKGILSAQNQPYYLSIKFIEQIMNSTEIEQASFIVNSENNKEVEFKQDIDITKNLHENSELILQISTNTTETVGFMLSCQPYHFIAHYRILIGFLILFGMICLLLFDIMNHAVIACLAASLVLLCLSLSSSLPSIETIVTWMDASTLCLVFSLMIIIQMLSTTGCFEYIACCLYLFSKGNSLFLHFLLCCLTAFLSAFLDNLTTMILLAPITIELAHLLKLSPIPFLLPEIIFSNIGGTATQIGDLPNIMIGSVLNEYITFIDFISNCLPCVLLCMIILYSLTFLFFRKDLHKKNHLFDPSQVSQYQIKNKPLCMKCSCILFTVILLFFFQSHHHINISFIALTGAIACLLLGSNEDLHTTFELLDWETLMYFAGLFIMTGGLYELGVIDVLSSWFISIIQSISSSLSSTLLLILWFTGLLSCFIDNVAIISIMIPIIRILSSKLQLPVQPLAWAVAFGSCFGGNGTLIGAGANLLTAGISSANGSPISFKQYFTYGFPCTLISLVISSVYLILRY